MNKSPYLSPKPWIGPGFVVPDYVDGYHFNHIYRDLQALSKPENAEALAKLLKYAERLDIQNQAIYDSLCAAHKNYCDLFNTSFAPDKKLDKKILNALDLVKPIRPIHWVKNIKDIVEYRQKEAARLAEDKTREEVQKAASAERERLHASATAFIMLRGYTIDFAANVIKNQDGREVGTVSGLVSFANDVAREEAIAEYDDEIEHSCCDSCNTWTKGEHRCDCGNRRMYWDYSGNFENMTVYPAAD